MPMSPRKRARTSRQIQYAVLVVVLIALVFVIDWSTIRQAFFDWDAAKAQFPTIIVEGLRNTLIFTVYGFGIGLAIALPLALMKLSQVAPYRWLSTAYVEFFRGVPALLVFTALGYGVPLAFGIRFDLYSTAGISLGIVGSAYMAETIRAGIQAVPPGQVEAARSLGMSAGRATRSIVLPQAFRIILPPLTNELILLIKDSSLIYLLGLSTGQRELTNLARDGLNDTGSMTPLVLAGFLYLVITVPLSYLSRRMEKRTGQKRDKGLEVTA